MSKSKIIRSAKLGNSWTENEMKAYNIKFEEQDVNTFFGLAAIDAELLSAFSTLDPDPGRGAQYDSNFQLLTQLKCASAHDSNEAVVDELSSAILKELRYIPPPLALFPRPELRLHVCGEARFAEPDICIRNRGEHDVISLVQEDKRVKRGKMQGRSS